MRLYFEKVTIFALIVFVFSSRNDVNGQTLGIQRLAGSYIVSIEASSPNTVRYRVEATTNFQTWSDIGDTASGALSLRISETNSQSIFYRLRSWPAEDTPVTVALVGDSTVADYAANMELFYGWGPGINAYMKPDVRVVNLAVPLQSTRSFLGSMEKNNLELIRPEFVLVQLGLNDTHAHLSSFYTTLPEYEANLRKIVEDIRAFEGTPVLITPPIPRTFDARGRVAPTYLEDRRQVVRKVAAELHAYLIDLNQLMRVFYNDLGPTQSAYITANANGDTSHFSLEGSGVIAGLVVNAFPGILKGYVLEATPQLRPAGR